jgi:adenine-specific DNA-methyltransferase
MARSDMVEFLKEVSGREGVVAKQFSGVFYTDDEDRWLDGYMSLASERRGSKEVTSLLRYLVYQACLKKRPFNLFHRANLHLRTKKRVKRSFGNFVTWERPFDDHILQAFDELALRPHLSGPKARVLQAGNVDDVPSGYDLVYVDPPYIGDNDGHNRDDYWRRYHFLEGLRHYTDWQSMIDKRSEIRLLASPSRVVDWRRKSSFPDRLFSLIEKHRRSIVVLSYTSGAHPTERALRDFFKSNFSTVSVRSRRHNHSLSNVSKRELLFIGHPKS